MNWIFKKSDRLTNPRKLMLAKYRVKAHPRKLIPVKYWGDQSRKLMSAKINSPRKLQPAKIYVIKVIIFTWNSLFLRSCIFQSMYPFNLLFFVNENGNPCLSNGSKNTINVNAQIWFLCVQLNGMCPPHKCTGPCVSVNA